MELVDGLEDKKYLAPREFVSRTFVLTKLPGEYCNPKKKKIILIIIIICYKSFKFTE